MKKIKNIALFFIGVCLLLACIPFYIIYAAGKTLGDLGKFFETACDILLNLNVRRKY